MIYINPRKGLDRESKKELAIQIDNSRVLGWKPKDIILVTNFEYEYNGVRSVVIEENLWCDYWAQVSKINALIYMFENGMIGDSLYWFHDLDAFQAHPILENELGLEGIDVGFTDYGYRRKWNTGSFFFKKSAEDILKLMRDRAYELQVDEERALENMTENNDVNVNNRIKRLNSTYNFPGSKGGRVNMNRLYRNVIKPVKVLHFHPERKEGRYFDMLKGNNSVNVCFIPERTLRVFEYHGIK